MKRSLFQFAIVCLIGGASTVAVAQDTATLKMKFVLDGALPTAEKIGNVNDPYCAQQNLVSDKIIVSDKGEIANLAIMFDEDKSKLKVPDSQAKPAEGKLELDNNKCLFNPKVLVAKPGQTIVVKNSDQTGHNANFQLLKNTPKNFLIPAGQSREYELAPGLVEPSAMPVNCDIHPWMKAFLIVKPHSYVGVTDASGVIEIKDLPAGKGAIFRVWHEAAGPITSLNVNGTDTKLSRGNRWELELKPGMNDLGVVKLDAKLLK